MNLGIHLSKNPAGTYSFSGTVPVRLARTNKDGSRLNDEEVRLVSQSCMPALHSKCRVWDSKEDALRAAEYEGIKRTEVKVGIQ